MVMQALESRYTVNADVLCDYLERKFSKGQFSVTGPERDRDKWMINVPRELTYDEKNEIKMKFLEQRQ